MNSIFDGDLSTAKGRTVAWIDSLFIDHAIFRLIWGNLAPVIPGEIYRCNHPTAPRLRRMTRLQIKHGADVIKVCASGGVVLNLAAESVR